MQRRSGCLLVGLVLALAGCSDDATLSAPLGSSPPAPASAPLESPSPSPSPAPVPSPSPALSAFERDPAVQGMRAHLRAVMAAINAGNLELPALVNTSTARRQVQNRTLFDGALGKYQPAPNPVAVLGVQVLSPTRRSIANCAVARGQQLDKKGGTPLSELVVTSGRFEMVLEGDTWKFDRAVRDESIACKGIALQGPLR